MVRISPRGKYLPSISKKPEPYGVKKSVYGNGRVLKYGHYVAPNPMRQAGMAMMKRPMEYVPIKISRMVI